MAMSKENESVGVETEKKEFDDMMEKGLAQAKMNQSRPAAEVLADISKNIREWAR